jgi:predicted XRE-type DNA-binding protein
MMMGDASTEAPIRFERGSGNVFADLGLPDPDEALARAGLAQAIAEAIRHRGLSRAEAGTITGLDAQALDAILRGRLGAVTRDQLMRSAAALDARTLP